MINIVIPMAGRGSRFAIQGFKDPKPLININGKFMIEGVINNLTPSIEHQFIFICQKEHLVNYKLEQKLKKLAPGSEIIPIDYVTEGAASTVLLAREYIDNNHQLMIANSDQWIDFDINTYLVKMQSDSLDGLIMTMFADDPKWSFVGLGDNEIVTSVVEKEVISNEATVGIYNFKKGSDFCSSADRMIQDEKRVNGEFYVAPVYNEMIELNCRIGIYNIGAVNNGMYGLGTPSDLDYFKNTKFSKYF